MPWTVTGAGEAPTAAEGRTVGTMGPAPAEAAGVAPTAGEARAAELGPAASVAPRVEVPPGGVGLWCTRGR